MKFYEKLKHLSPQEIGHIVQEIIKRCPSAFKENGNDHAQLVVDNLDSDTFHLVVGMMEDSLTRVEERVASKIQQQ